MLSFAERLDFVRISREKDEYFDSANSWSTHKQIPYDYDFENINGGLTLYEVVENYQRSGGQARVVDIMGYGDVLRDLPISSGVALALSDSRFTEDKSYDNEHGIAFVKGDVLSPRSWRLVRENLPGRMAEIVLARPMGGLMKLPDSPLAHLFLLKRMYDLTAPGGRVLTQSDEKYNHELQFLVENMLRVGVYARVETNPYKVWPALRIDKPINNYPRFPIDTLRRLV